LKKIAQLEEQNGKLQYRVNHLVKCAKSAQQRGAIGARPACAAFNSKPLVLAQTSAFSTRLSLRTMLEAEFGGVEYAGNYVFLLLSRHTSIVSKLDLHTQ
jgi:hypothetical protein